MGFRLNRTYALRWEAGDLQGLEIDMRSTSVGTLGKVLAMLADRDEGTLAQTLVEHVIRWNFEDENGEELPVTVESLMQQEAVLLAAIAREWILATRGVTAPLDDGSTSSEPSEPELSIPMETL